MATKRQKIREQIAAESNLKPVKPKRKRKPMTAEQKKAAAERLEKAREARMAKAGAPKSVAAEVLAKPDDDNLSLKNVRQWIKVQKDVISSLRRDVKAGLKGAEAKLASAEGYVRNLETYIRTGIYLDMFWGEYAQNKMRNVCIVMAYDADGNPKRNGGTFYPDINAVYVGPGRIERDGEIIEVDYV
jgi:hypothetical protein